MNLNSQISSLHLSQEEARAALSLTGSPEWQVVSKYLERCLELARDEMEIVTGDKQIRIQGRCAELRSILDLPTRAERVLEGAKTRG